MNLLISLCVLSLSSNEPQFSNSNPIWAVTDTQIVKDFVLYNPRLTAIPLVIPGIMNPNLSPRSRSSVQLAVGQEIYLVRNGKRELLYTVPSNLAPGSEINCGTLISELERPR
jgi:hypothetical protein